METPLSSRRITKSQAIEDCNSNTIPMSSRVENEGSNKGVLKSRHQEREKPALIDITNGSPIVGLAMGSLKTPSSRCSKKRMMVSNTLTPGSGETLLRGQVKTLLQKVEEEAVISRICFDDNSLVHKCFMNSPIAILAPTPANTPQVYSFSTSNDNGLESFAVSPVAENFNFTQLLNEVIAESSQEDKGEGDEKDVITRSLFMDLSEKSNGYDSSDCSSLLTCQDSDSSLWSVQVNASTSEVDELCEEMSKISVNKADKFTGKHMRFVYDSESSSSSSKGSI
ncbi:hypothetical protein L1987_65695 [Smallanthus sonchifolius]|uniref:Uncharacterized protein n=1 Tax=Smallanthus sonchifolius TaxID=185202 RepID=A0ACB9BV28_9ASTR|nr:hypothetical protein L1987_65695 [Smallanthus sonchifolius]